MMKIEEKASPLSDNEKAFVDESNSRKLILKADVNNGRHKVTAPGPFVPPIGMLVDLAGFRYRVHKHHAEKGEITLRAIGYAKKLKRFPLHQAILMRFQALWQQWFGTNKETAAKQAAQQ